MKVMITCEAEDRKINASMEEQCFIILLEARARECIGVASLYDEAKASARNM